MKRPRLAPCLLSLALLVLGALGAAAGPPDEPIGDGHFGRVRTGWDNLAPANGLAPVTLLLDNPDARRHTIRAVVGVGGTVLEETVELAPGAKRRVSFVVPTPNRQKVSVSLAEDGKLLASSEHDTGPLASPSVLLVDGDSSTRQIAQVVSGVACLACALEDVPSELACLAPFGAIVIRRANPVAAGEGVRGALDDYVRAGGTIVVAPNANNALTRTFWEDVAAPARARGTLFLEKRHGLGRILLAPGDPCALDAQSDAISRALALELDLAPRRIFPRFFTGETPNEAAHRAGKLLAASFGLYFVVAGPFLARRLRGAPPARVLRFVALLVLSFTALAVVIASSVRHQVSHVDALTFVVVPEEGEPVAVTEVIVSSGGAPRETVVLDGDDVSATAAQRTAPFTTFDYRVSNSPLWTPTSVSTCRAFGRHPVTFEDLAVPTLGDVRVNAISGAKGYRPLDVQIEVDPATGERSARVVNTSGHALGAIAVYETGHQGELLAARFPHGLEAGASGVAPITTRSASSSPAHLVGFPPTLFPVGWESLPPRGPDGSDPRYVLLAEDESPVHATAKSALVRQRTWRVEAVAPPTTSTVLPGSVGLKVKPSGTGVRVTQSNRLQGARRIQGWLPSVGTTILTVGGVPVHSQEDLDRAFSRVEKDGWVEVATTDQRFSIKVGPVAPPIRTPTRKPAVPVKSVPADDE